VRVTIPKSVSEGLSELEIGCLIGRIIASQMADNKEKGMLVY